MAPVVLAPLLAKGVGLGASALKYLPVIGAVGGALPGLRKGNLGEAALGSGFGALSGSLGTGGLITGATGLIGGSLVKKFISLVGNVLASGKKSEKLDLIKKNNPNVKIKKFNLAEHSAIEEFINSAALELGGLDILVNNAGINSDNLSLRMKDDEWKKVIDINLTSTFLLSKYAIKK